MHKDRMEAEAIIRELKDFNSIEVKIHESDHHFHWKESCYTQE